MTSFLDIPYDGADPVGDAQDSAKRVSEATRVASEKIGSFIMNASSQAEAEARLALSEVRGTVIAAATDHGVPVETVERALIRRWTATRNAGKGRTARGAQRPEGDYDKWFKEVACSTCYGKGWVYVEGMVRMPDCPECKGTGLRAKSSRRGLTASDEMLQRGFVWGECSACHDNHYLYPSNRVCERCADEALRDLYGDEAVDAAFYGDDPDRLGSRTAAGSNKCDNCDWVGPTTDLNEIQDYFQRVDEGGEVPSGECPECGALAYPVSKSSKVAGSESKCDTCGWSGSDAEVHPIEDVWNYLEPGDPAPSGGCPQCGSFAYPTSNSSRRKAASDDYDAPRKVRCHECGAETTLTPDDLWVCDECDTRLDDSDIIEGFSNRSSVKQSAWYARSCTTCGRGMNEGWEISTVADLFRYCSEKCAIADMPPNGVPRENGPGGHPGTSSAKEEWEYLKSRADEDAGAYYTHWYGEEWDDGGFEGGAGSLSLWSGFQQENARGEYARENTPSRPPQK